MQALLSFERKKIMVGRFLEYDVNGEHFKNFYNFNLGINEIITINLLYGGSFLKDLNNIQKTRDMTKFFQLMKKLLLVTVQHREYEFTDEHAYLMTLSLFTDPKQDFTNFCKEIFDPNLQPFAK